MSIISYGQVKDTTLFISKKELKIEYSIKLNKSELKKYLDNFRTSYVSSSNKASISINGILNNIPLSQYPCENGSFENNSSDWTGLSLKHSSSPIPIENGLTLNPGIQPIPSINNPSSYGNFIAIESPGNDLILTAASPSFNLPKVVSGTKSIRLGNNSAGFGAEGIAKRFVVTPQNAQYFFQYAIIMDKSHSYPDGSTNGTEVFFIAEAVDMAGNTIDKIVDIGNPSNPFINAVSSSWGVNAQPNNVFYRNWRCASLDLSSKIGQEVVVMFINSDCSAGAHKGYTYIDAVCETCVNTNEGDIDINLSPDNCMDFPQTIGGTFTLPASGNAINSTINLQIFQNNILVATLTSPTISGGNYSFTLSPGDFPNQDNGQCYDLVSNLTFDIPDMNGNLQTITQTSSTIVNGIQDGEIPGINNDVCFCSPPPPCCDIKDFDATIQENNGSFNVNISGGSVPLQEVEISMIDYHIEYSERDCKPDDLGIFGTLTTSTTNLNNLILNAGDNGTSSLSWLLGNPSIINSAVNLDILYPDVLNLECCDVEFYFCLKVKVKDVNCNVCEKIICFNNGNDPTNCECGKWLNNTVSVKPIIKKIPQDPKLKINVQTNLGQNIDCGGKITLKPTMNYSFTAPDYTCNPSSCNVNYTWEIIGKSGIIKAGTGKTVNYSFSNYGTYQVAFTPICGGKECEPCIITVIIDKFIQHNPDPIGIPHDLPSGDVYNPKTGKTWMNKNLGATRVATSPTDAAAFGDLYQWGRLTDGHEKRTSSISNTLSSTDIPGHNKFIAVPNSQDWRVTSNNNLWQGVNGINNPCPSGYRLPTAAEFDAERLSWITNNAAGAFASPLKWTMAGARATNGTFAYINSRAFYLSSNIETTNQITPNGLQFTTTNAYIYPYIGRTNGASVRCIKN